MACSLIVLSKEQRSGHRDAPGTFEPPRCFNGCHLRSDRWCVICRRRVARNAGRFALLSTGGTWHPCHWRASGCRTCFGAVDLCGCFDRHLDLGGFRERVRLVATGSTRRRDPSASSLVAHALGNAQSRFCGAAVENGRDIATMGRRRRGAIALVVGLSSTYHEIDGTIVAATSQPRSFRPVAQPDEDWRAYWRTQFGQRYSPLRQITPANVSNLKVARTFRTGDLPGPNDPGETTSKVTPIKARNSLYLCPPHQRLFALDAKPNICPGRSIPRCGTTRPFSI
jgi:hypothetical protein